HGVPRDVLSLRGAELFAYRRKVQFVFQDPFSSLNPRMTAYDIVSEPLVIHGIGDEDERFQRVKEMMALVGLDVRFLRRYPHSFSGGQRQRIGIARAPAAELFRNPQHPYTKALLAAVPDPDLTHKLDFDALMQGKASDPSAWPGEFRIADGSTPELIKVANDRLVRARA